MKITNDDTDQWEVKFYENGQKCEALEIDLEKNKIAKQYSAYNLISDDLELLLKWTKQLKNRVDDFENNQKRNDLTKHFGVFPEKYNEVSSELLSSFVSISIIYGRLFSETKSRGVSLDHKYYIRDKLQLIHKELTKTRNDYIAHLSNKMYADAKTFIVLNPLNRYQFRVVYQSRKVYFPASKFIDEITELFENLSEKIKNKISELDSKLIEEYKNNQIIFK